MRAPKPLLILMGMMGRTPFAGVAWQVLHYLEGFRRLGYDVWYVEDTGDWPYDPERNAITGDWGYTVRYIARLMARCGLADRWAYRAPPPDGRTFGASDTEVARLFERAHALVNLTGATILRDEHLRVPVRIYLQTDPVLAQIEIVNGRAFTIDLLAAHTHHFSFGENFGAPDCLVPVERFDFLPTRQPVVVDWWADEHGLPPLANDTCTSDGTFTTVGSWRQSGNEIDWNGERYLWSKHYEFLKFIELPSRTAAPIELALANIDDDARGLLRSNGWRVVDALALSTDTLPYRDYIMRSRGEFTVAKDQNIRLRSGWFSDRSACYLAAGRPVVTQDTAFGNVVPTGRGLFDFRTVDEAVAALDAVATDCIGHRRAAREIATEYFAAEKVLAALAERAGL